MAEGKLGILVGGGPAPGINGVISAVTLEALNHGVPVLGFREGFSKLIKGDVNGYVNLDFAAVDHIHFRGGAILGTSRANPTKDPQGLENVVKVFEHHDVRYLVTIGGDDTAFSSSAVAKATQGRVRVAHVPKTIDNDLPLPPGVPTFGYQTARHVGVGIIKNLMQDAQTTPRWYLVVAMGRQAGHLSLGIGKASAAPLTLIPEEFLGRDVTFREVCDIVEGAVIKRQALGRQHGVAILAEGLIEGMAEEEIKQVFSSDDIEYDEHGHIRLDNLDLGAAIRDELKKRFKARGQKMTFVAKNLGYELRSADPIPYDIEYTRNLGYGAVKYLMSGNSGAIVAFHGGALNPLPFAEVQDPNRQGRMRIRNVDVHEESYEVARRYMTRLEPHDKQFVPTLAQAANLTPEQFQEKFAHLLG